VDGGNIMDDGSNASINVYPSLEAIEEVEVLTSNYGAQYGRNSSGTIEVETKSGTNAFHGGLYEFVRNDMFNACNYFDNLNGAPRYKKHDFGYNVGGARQAMSLPSAGIEHRKDYRNPSGRWPSSPL
jgi:outer membrane receptor protein involved in Fe transport